MAVGAVFAGIRDLVYGISSEKIGKSVRIRFYESIIRKDIGFYDDRKVGDICKYWISYDLKDLSNQLCVCD